MKRQIGLPVALIFLAFTQMAFDFSRHNIPLNEIYDGGPPKDGIPALYDPRFVKADKAGFLSPGDRVLGLSMNGEAKAYPIKILNWHELVNDRVGGKWVLVSYCPLCGTGMAFDAELNGQRFLFGVSGKLYNSDVLFYDKKRKVSGPKSRCKPLPVPWLGPGSHFCRSNTRHGMTGSRGIRNLKFFPTKQAFREITRQTLTRDMKITKRHFSRYLMKIRVFPGSRGFWE